MGTPEGTRVVIGLQGAQMPANAIRGIGRWSSQFTLAMVQSRPELVAAISVDPTLPLPAIIDRIPLDVPILPSHMPPPAEPGEPLVFHALSVIEDLPLEAIWPHWARRPEVSFVPTVYDMIPSLYPSDYFRGGLRHLLTARLALIKQSDAVMALSQTTAADVARLLGYQRSKIFVVYGSIGSQFRPHLGGSKAAAAQLPPELGLRPGFVLSIGNVDPRKNLPRLIQAYAALPAGLRVDHQLVITCSQADPDHLTQLRRLAAKAGVADQVLVTGYVDDPTMLLLYQACGVMAFPSFYEGLGLPLVEAMRSGALAVTSDLGAMKEVVRDPAARFDPNDPASMSATLQRVLSDDRLAAGLRRDQYATSLTFQWRRAADDAAHVYDQARWT